MPTPGPTGPVSGLSVTFTAFHTKSKAQTEAALSSSTMGLLLKGENRQRHVSKEKEGKWRRWRPVEEAKGGWRRKWEVLGVGKCRTGLCGRRQETPGQYKHFLAFALLPQDSSLTVFFMCWETGFEQESAGSPTEHPLQIGTLGPSVAPRMARHHSLLEEVLLGEFPPWAAPSVNLLLLFMFKDKVDLSSCINFPQRKLFRTWQISPDDVSERLIIATCRKG